MLFLTVEDLAIGTIADHQQTWGLLSHTLWWQYQSMTMLPCAGSAVCGSGLREDIQIKDSMGKKNGDAFCMLVSSGTGSPTCFSV